MAHPDFQRLEEVLLPFAQEMIEQHGSFILFGFSVMADGRIVSHAAYSGAQEPPPDELLDTLTQTFREQAADGLIRAIGLCLDVTVVPPGEKEKTNAICLELEHESGEAVDLVVPYRAGRTGKITYGKKFSRPGSRELFASKNRVD